MKRLILLSLLLSLCLSAGCATVPGAATTPTVKAQVAVTQTLQAVGVTLKATPQVLDALYAAGKISKDTYNQAATAYNKTLGAYQLAVAALNAVVAAGQDPNTSTSYLVALAGFSTNQDNLNNLMIALGGAK